MRRRASETLFYGEETLFHNGKSGGDAVLRHGDAVSDREMPLFAPAYNGWPEAIRGLLRP